MTKKNRQSCSTLVKYAVRAKFKGTVMSGRSDHPESGTIGWAQNRPLTDKCYTFFVVEFLKSSTFFDASYKN